MPRFLTGQQWKSKIKSDSEEKLIDKNENIPEQVAKENILNKSHK